MESKWKVENGEGWCKFTLEGGNEPKRKVSKVGEERPSVFSAPAGLPTPDFKEMVTDGPHDHTMRWESDVTKSEKEGKVKTKASHHHHLSVPMATALHILPPHPAPMVVPCVAPPTRPNYQAIVPPAPRPSTTWCHKGDKDDCSIPTVADQPSCVNYDDGLADLMMREEMADLDDNPAEASRGLSRVLAARAVYRREQSIFFDKLK